MVSNPGGGGPKKMGGGGGGGEKKKNRGSKSVVKKKIVSRAGGEGCLFGVWEGNTPKKKLEKRKNPQHSKRQPKTDSGTTKCTGEVPKGGGETGKGQKTQITRWGWGNVKTKRNFFGGGA